MISEYEKFINEFPAISFNDTEAKRNKAHWLFQLECYYVSPHNYEQQNFSQYRGIFTWNSKIFDKLKTDGHIVNKINGFPLFDNYSELKEFIPIEKKEGVCLICRYRGYMGPHDTAHYRISVFDKLKYPIKHCYGKIPYLGDLYKGPIGTSENELWPSSLEKLKVLNQHKFNLCFENCYHPLWSWDYITEKLFDTFLSKTVAVYYGCFNIEQIIPTDLYIDFRRFGSTDECSDYLNNFSNDQIYEMTEKAFEWINKYRNKYGNVSELRNFINKVIS